MSQNFILKVRNYLRLVKFEHTIFALPFAMIGFVLPLQEGDYSLSLILLLKILLCMVFARNAAMGFNRYIDRKIDAANPRTTSREIPAGKISSGNALIFVILNSLFFIAVTYFINPLCFYLSFVALFVVLGYSLTKRFTSLAHFVLGLGLAIAPTAAYMSVTGTISLITILFSLIVLFWVSGFDILYSLADEEFDREHKLHSVPQLMGRKNAMILSSVLHFLILPLLMFIYFVGGMGYIYIVGGCFFALLLLYQHLIISPKNLTKLDAAFFTTNGIASVIFSIFVIFDIIIKIL